MMPQLISGRGWCPACQGYAPTIEFIVDLKRHTETVDVRCATHLTTLYIYERPRTRKFGLIIAVLSEGGVKCQT